MKVVFLDIDGVLTSFKMLAETGVEDALRFDESTVANLNRLVALTNAKLVISSKRKTDPHLPQQFKEAGIQAEVLGVTPDREDLSTRDEEISAWLDAAREVVESFVIIDDQCQNGIADYFPQNFVEVNPMAGFNEQALQEALAILGIQPAKA